jgi:hypothetical protein
MEEDDGFVFDSETKPGQADRESVFRADRWSVIPPPCLFVISSQRPNTAFVKLPPKTSLSTLEALLAKKKVPYDVDLIFDHRNGVPQFESDTIREEEMGITFEKIGGIRLVDYGYVTYPFPRFMKEVLVRSPNLKRLMGWKYILDNTERFVVPSVTHLQLISKWRSTKTVCLISETFPNVEILEARLKLDDLLWCPSTLQAFGGNWSRSLKYVDLEFFHTCTLNVRWKPAILGSNIETIRFRITSPAVYDEECMSFLQALKKCGRIKLILESPPPQVVQAIQPYCTYVYSAQTHSSRLVCRLLSEGHLVRMIGRYYERLKPEWKAHLLIRFDKVKNARKRILLLMHAHRFGKLPLPTDVLHMAQRMLMTMPPEPLSLA